MAVTATATDATSGVSSLEVLTDGGAYQAYTAPISFTDGHHTVQFKATDNAGNVTITPVQEFFVDTTAPTIDIPVSWEVGKTIDYSVLDTGSGLATLRIVIEDEDEKYAKVAWDEVVSGSSFTGEITWDGKFADGTIAPPGEYLVWIKATDKAGNERFAYGRVIVPEPNVVFSLFKSETTSQGNPVPPKELTNPTDALEISSVTTSPFSSFTTFGGSTATQKESTTEALTLASVTTSSSTTTNSNVLWGATAAAMIGATMAYALDDKRKRKEEEAQQKVQVQAEVDAKNTALEAGRQARREAAKIQGWLQGQAMLEAYIEEAERQGADVDEIAALRQEGAEKGFGVAIENAVTLNQTLFAQNVARQQAQDAFRIAERNDAAVAAWQAEQRKIEEQRQAAELQAGLAAYYNGMRQGEQEAQTTWWEKAVDFVQENIIQPVTEFVQVVSNPVPQANTTLQGGGVLAAPVAYDGEPGFWEKLINGFEEGLNKTVENVKESWNTVVEGVKNFFNGNSSENVQPTPDVNAIQTQVVQTVVAQFTQTAQAMLTPTPTATPTLTPTPSVTAFPGIPMFVLVDGLNLRQAPSAFAASVFHDERSIPRGSMVYVNPNQPILIRDGFCWVPATYIDPTINARAIAASPQFLDPLVDFIRWTAHGQPITYNNAMPSPWAGTHIGEDYVPLPSGNPNPIIRASAPGIVVNSGEQSGGYGNYVIIEYPHTSLPTIQRLPEYQKKPGNSLYAMYAHLLNNVSDTLPAGSLLIAGTTIGNMGKSGNGGDLIHLHLELRLGDPNLTNETLNASNGKWYKPDILLPIDPALIFTPNDIWNGWAAQYQCSANGQPTGEPFIGSTP